ncbi:hypothetical protein GIB67_038213 [Kingdonia uniflora]|uniref:GHMP kinase C-terminal domain-containing protein n=1 Tax=Kingdonia uniflora TaxID=39325 RepID=A0A7J7NH08_9MAGN|nr:hypothetical protein GIB67_038213 [Kingdonia uniflora]
MKTRNFLVKVEALQESFCSICDSKEENRSHLFFECQFSGIYGQIYSTVKELIEDFSKEYMDKLGHGIYTPMDISLLPPLHLIYAENPSDSGKVHSTVRKRWLDGEEFIISSMTEVAKLPLEGRTALLGKDYTKFASLMNRNFDLRRSMFGDDALGSMNIEMVEVARSVGAASKFTGSGGAIIAFCKDGPSQVKLLEDACEKAGFIVQPALVVPSFPNDTDLETNFQNK